MFRSCPVWFSEFGVGIPPIGTNVAHPREHVPDRFQRDGCAVSILNICAMIRPIVSVTPWRLRRLIFFPMSKPRVPPLCVVLTLWLSTMPDEGLASRPMASLAVMTRAWVIALGKAAVVPIIDALADPWISAENHSAASATASPWPALSKMASHTITQTRPACSVSWLRRGRKRFNMAPFFVRRIACVSTSCAIIRAPGDPAPHLVTPHSFQHMRWIFPGVDFPGPWAGLPQWFGNARVRSAMHRRGGPSGRFALSVAFDGFTCPFADFFRRRLSLSSASPSSRVVARGHRQQGPGPRCGITLARSARRGDEAGKLYPPAVQRTIDPGQWIHTTSSRSFRPARNTKLWQIRKMVWALIRSCPFRPA